MKSQNITLATFLISKRCRWGRRGVCLLVIIMLAIPEFGFSEEILLTFTGNFIVLALFLAGNILITRWWGMRKGALTLRWKIGVWAGSLTAYNLLLVCLIGVVNTLSLPPMDRPASAWEYIYLVLNQALSIGVFVANLTVWVLLRSWLMEVARYENLNEACKARTYERLKALLSPHVLINAINGATMDLYDDRRKFAGSLLALRNLLRLLADIEGRQYITLAKECDVMSAYLAMECNDSSRRWTLASPSGELAAEKIRPLMLLPLIENAVKHGEGDIGINIGYDGKRLTFECINGVPTDGRAAPPRGGIGLANLAQRLQLTYPGHYSLQFHTAGTKFISTLQIEE